MLYSSLQAPGGRQEISEGYSWILSAWTFLFTMRQRIWYFQPKI